ncbi:MAG: pyruvate ferredoxin oxidoreductase [Gemmatimonadales bacterium]|nr:pyruvate ferredoxin oxidoreductase [Gemmatimonadales bacterium]NIN10909.1 pyruvate ferredoxin oxidoreductase [Gemmatimonadales bacterium]NIN49507.1 pyruvate ferredoxin oxidoreductase [Gemmatimonadales bacterium]NIP06971.1 pyruvate ferredoxin oxidoreductase [Gemmatimonadales bacterium]NIQ99031.1 pyruvate ferredoxin oxidoreductase [Gemmatimonadales bacterium]
MFKRIEPDPPDPKYPGIPTAVDGTAAVVEMETAASEGAGAYPITPSTQMGEGWAAAVAAGKTNVNGRRLIFFEPEGEHAAAAVTAGMSMVGLRAANFSSGQGIAYMHESLYAAAGKRLTYVLNIGARAMTKHALNVHAGHDDYHAIDDTGFFQLFAKDAQECADLSLIAHKIAELSLNPGALAQDGFLTTHVIETMRMPERELVKEFLGDPADIIESPTPAQRWVFGEKRRRIPEIFDLDYPALLGPVQNQDSYHQGVAAQRPFYFDHVVQFADQAMAEYAELTGRRYARATGYRLDDAEYVIVGQGSVVANAEAVIDHLRETRGLKVGVLNVTMFRPFPADLITRLLRGKKGVTVLERVDQPLAVDLPILREIRAAVNKALENGRANGTPPYRDIARYTPDNAPDFYSGCFGLGSRDLQPSDIIAAVDNMLGDGKHIRQFYLGIDFVREGTRLPKLQIWQEELLEGYPNIPDLALTPKEYVDLMPEGSISIRMHSIGGWGAITTGKNIAMTASELLGMYIKANPKYGSEKKGQPTTFYATLAKAPIRLNCELKHVNVVLSPDPNVFRHSDPLAGLAEGGVFVIQSDRAPEDLWNSLPGSAQKAIQQRKLKVHYLDAFKIATEEATDPELRYRMQGAAFMGAFFRTSPLMEREGLDEEKLFEGIRVQLAKKFGHLGERVVEDNLRVIRRGFDEARELNWSVLPAREDEVGAVPVMPAILDGTNIRPGLANPGRFWEQVCYLYKTGQDGIADPFAALSAMPAATSTIRDMTDVRFEVPDFIPANCTGCAQCWTQCPDSAIPGVVNTVEDVITAAIATVSNGRSFDRLNQIVRHLGNESRKIMKGVPFTNFADVLSQAYKAVVEKLKLDPERRAALDEQFAPVYSALSEFPLAKTGPFFDVLEDQEKGTGGLLSITVNPDACKGCNICVEVCPDNALKTVPQDDEIVDRLRRNWKLWENLPDTEDRYVNIASLEEGIGILSSLLLKKDNYRAMVGGDGACMGCGEKTVIHLLLGAVNALMLPRVEKYVQRLDELIAGLDEKARKLLASDADLNALGVAEGKVDIPLEDAKKQAVERISKMIDALKDLRWRYTEGPTGKGRATLGMTNATGCSSVWGSTYPYNPYPFPWVNHLFQDAPSVAIGIFEGHMRKMADGFVAVRRAELELSSEYDPTVHEPFFTRFDWRQFSDEEFGMCPPIFATGGDGAMLDIGFQNLSRLLASGKAVRVIVLDTQVYSNTGGQACTSGYLGQVSDMAAYGKAQHGKEETRKELALLAMAHRNVFVLQSSQASPAHLLGGVIKGLQSRHPAVFALHCPCPPEHGLGDDQAPDAAKLALESRGYPLLQYDPDAGTSMAECLSLDGNPSEDDPWPTYDLKYVDENGEEQTMELPVTTADWAATEARFKKHFKKVPADAADDELTAFHEYLQLSPEDRDEKTPFIYVLENERRLGRLSVSQEIVELAEDRLRVWSLLREMAGLEEEAGAEAEAEFEQKAAGIRAEYEAKLANLKARYPQVIARRMAEGLLRAGDGKRTIADLLADVQSMTGLTPIGADVLEGFGGGPAAPAAPAAPGTPAAEEAAVATVAAPAVEEEALVLEPYIDSIRCTTCDECTKLNRKMFAYNEKKQAYIKDPRAGKFKDLVTAAERCPVRIIHPGTPLNPKEKDLDKWIKRAEPFN